MPFDESSPAGEIAQNCAYEILLLALEAARDVLVGWTDDSLVLDDAFDALFVSAVKTSEGRSAPDVDKAEELG